MPKTQLEYLALNALKTAHTDLHQAIHEVEHDQSKRLAKEKIVLAINKIAQALINL